MLDKPVSQKLLIARCYGTYVMNGNTKPKVPAVDDGCRTSFPSLGPRQLPSQLIIVIVIGDIVAATTIPG